jgi:uncharacterized membrane protein (UPF0127 family)
MFAILLLTHILVGGHPLEVDVAATEEERRIGLMGREPLPENTGMLFVYEEPEMLRFWMKNVKFPIDIGFFDRKKTLIQVETMPANKTTEYKSYRPAMYALEVSAGWFSKHQVNLGDKLEFR